VHSPHDSEPDSPRRLALLALGALGVVYGDIGTSPLYALRECFHGPHAIAPTPDNILGVLSLFFWSLIIVISVKYLAFVMRADNRGEGGMLALMALVMQRTVAGNPGRNRRVLVWMGLFGAGLIYGDGIITPAVSVLSATEGLVVATPGLEPYVVPLTIVILVALFVMQSHGTGGVGKIFGPMMLLWFVTIGTLGARSILALPEVLRAVWPGYAVSFFLHNGMHGFLLLAVVILVITGGEALYADMGHFGRQPIRIAWFAVALPALLLNYFGQGALLLRNPAADSPFYQLVPTPLLYPGGARHAGGQHRQPGAHLRRLQHHPPGHPAGLQPAPGGGAHLGGGGGADLPARRQLADARGRGGAGAHLPLLEQPGGGLWHGHHGRHVHHHGAGVRGGPRALEGEPRGGLAGDGALPGH
jgi:KUP system potassium uptake protein